MNKHKQKKQNKTQTEQNKQNKIKTKQQKSYCEDILYSLIILCDDV
jgi:hypothetical protein